MDKKELQELASKVNSLIELTSDKQEKNILGVAAGIIKSISIDQSTKLSQEKFNKLIEEGHQLMKEFKNATKGRRILPEY